MLPPIIHLLDMILNILGFLLLVWVVFSWLIGFRILNPHQPLVFRINDALTRLFEPMLRPIRKYLPNLGTVDIAPLVLLLAIHFARYCLFYYFAP